MKSDCDRKLSYMRSELETLQETNQTLEAELATFRQRELDKITDEFSMDLE